MCRSVATPDMDDFHRVQSMSACIGNPLARIARGDIVRLHSEYLTRHVWRLLRPPVPSQKHCHPINFST